MDGSRIGEIVGKVFEKAKRECASHTKYALAQHVSVDAQLSSKTLERVYDRYINGRESVNTPNAESVDCLCRYLGLDGYKDYVRSYPRRHEPHKPQPEAVRAIGGTWRQKRKLIVTITMAFGSIVVGHPVLCLW